MLQDSCGFHGSAAFSRVGTPAQQSCRRRHDERCSTFRLIRSHFRAIASAAPSN